MRLLELKQGDTAVIDRINGGAGMRYRMDGFGLREGKRIRLIMAAPFRGPLLLEDLGSGARIMIGRGMAESVEVSRCEPS
ncbi:MAG TPA: FeoA family protein [Deltaproteobacteria bacterium]|nr:FeoA family protein [Deltaproteobacteria bacterium]